MKYEELEFYFCNLDLSDCNDPNRDLFRELVKTLGENKRVCYKYESQMCWVPSRDGFGPIQYKAIKIWIWIFI